MIKSKPVARGVLYLLLVLFLLVWLPVVRTATAVELRGEIVDAVSGAQIAARLYIKSETEPLEEGQVEQWPWFFARSASTDGSAVIYRVKRSAESIEAHTTLSADFFLADLPAGRYTLTAECGKEYQTAKVSVEIGSQPVTVSLRLTRWIDMNALGWYSGETHVHRQVADLPNLMRAEHLNVALPLTYWVTNSGIPPTQGDKNSPAIKPELIRVDPTHVIYPMNTEYEIFRVNGQRHTLGAIFAINHKSVFTEGVPPVSKIAQQTHEQGELLELDKHNWPWSMMLVPIMKVDLYELTNNHIWRAPFFFRDFGTPPPAYMKVEQDDPGMTERGWIDYTFQNYYALLNCGFRLRPTAGTASGVHPVPLGFGRVYVHLPDGFSYAKWMDGLDQGRTFVTTGPMMEVTVADNPPGSTITASSPAEYRLSGWIRSGRPLTTIEVVSAGEVIKTITPQNRQMNSTGFESRIDEAIPVASSTWLTVRCFETTSDGRPRFAHSSPTHIDVAGKPLRPRRVEVEYLVSRVQSELERHKGVLEEPALAEYRAALVAYQRLLANSK
jgi:hypothetical protein